MKTWLNRGFWSVCRCFLGLRYRTRVTGAEALPSLVGPTLVLPNHPAYVDPPLVLSHLRLSRPLRPLVFSGTYRLWFLRPLMSLVDAFEVPDLSAHSRDAHARTREMIDAAVQRLQQGDCLLIYPSGRLQRGHRELVGAARAVHEIVQRCPQVNVVLVRTRGVWGSMFSCAQTGSLPPLGKRIVAALGWALASGGLFLPRRPVTLSVHVADRKALPLATRDAFNRCLEDWYNSDGEQAPVFVPYHHWFGPREGHFAGSHATAEVDETKLRKKTIRLVNELIRSHVKRTVTDEELRRDTPLEALGLDSLDRMDLALQIEQQFGFRSASVAATVGELWALAHGLGASAAAPAAAPPPGWNRAAARPRQPELLASTVAEAFVRRALLQPGDVCAADALSGVLTYRRFLVAAQLLSRRLQKLEARHVAIMLPASIAADIVCCALHLAGKIPVMLNWTTGPAHLAHGVRVTGVQQIVTSHKMIDRLGIDVPGADYLFLEELKAAIPKSESLWTLLCTAVAPRRLLRRLPPQQPDDPAVFLFTSGSESAPKTVPLSHRNLLVNIEAGLEVLQPRPADALLGFLPPFHSFGLTGNLLLPYLTGIRTVRYPDPTDAAGLVRTIATYQPTLIFTTPTFLGYIFAACQSDELRSLRTIITGAEKCPQAIFEQCRQLAPHAVILEGYGITECSPVVAANFPQHCRPGTVGRPLKYVDTCVVHPENYQPVAPGETGMLLVAGPSVFHGYYHYDGPSPFVQRNGRNWYKTGDLVAIDPDGFLHFHGRLKRFLKAGGEMISLPALEEPFARRFPPDEQGPQVAVEGLETDDGRHIVLFTTQPISLREASEILLADGLRGVMRLDEVRQVARIPVLGTGKTDYKQLRNGVLESAASPPAQPPGKDMTYN